MYVSLVDLSVKRPQWEKTAMEKDRSGKRPQYIKDRMVYIGNKTTLDKRPHKVIVTNKSCHTLLISKMGTQSVPTPLEFVMSLKCVPTMITK